MDSKEGTTKRQGTNIQKIKIFPNPATNAINILGLQNSSRAEILISNIYGSVVLKHSWQQTKKNE